MLVANSAEAQEAEPTRVGLEFSAPAACATIGQFEHRVHLRSERIAFVDQPPYTGSARVTLIPTGADVRVRLSWTREGTGATGREFSAPTCAEAVDAAALVIAITFDPSAPAVVGSSGTDTPATQRDSTAAANTRDDRSSQVEPDADNTSDTRDQVGTQALDIPATDAGAPRNEPTKSSEIVVSASATALVEGINGVAPTAMQGLGLAAAVSVGSGWLVPEFRLSAAHFFQVTYPADGGDARFDFDAAHLAICPVRLGRARYSLRPCGTVLGGRIEASGTNTLNPERHTRPLWALGGSLLASVRPASILVLTGEIGLSAPLSRDRFQFDPSEFHQVSSLIVSGTFGLGFELP